MKVCAPTSILGSVLDEPVVIEILLSLVVTALIVWAVRRLVRIARRLDQRRALREFVRGMDHFLRAEYERASVELQKVLERDPENVEARIAYGDALREMGQAADAHRHHYEVRKVFGHDLVRNDISIARDLLALGDHESAIPELERALDRGYQDDGAVEDLRDACLATGRHERAVGAGREVLERARDGASREEARRTLARALTLAAIDGLERGETRGVASLLEEAVRLAPELVQARMELVRAKLAASGAKAGSRAFAEALREMRRLAEEGEIVFEPLAGGPKPAVATGGPDVAGSLPAPTGTTPAPERIESRRTALLPGPDDGSRDGDHLPATRAKAGPSHDLEPRPSAAPPAFAEDVLSPGDMEPLLDRAARAFCEDCGRTARDWTERCPGCGAFGSMRPRNTTRLNPIPNAREVLDEIEESRAYVKRLCRHLSEGDETAERPLQRVGRRAVPLLFRASMEAPDARPIVACIGRMGPVAVPALLEAWRRTRSFVKRRVLGEKARRRTADSIFVSVLVAMPGDIEPILRDLLERPEPEVRLLALDAMLRTGRTDLAEEARLLFGARDLVDRLNEMETEEVAEIVEAAEPDSHLARVVFPDRTFRHDEALVQALVRGGDRDRIVTILRSRGFAPGVVEALLVHAQEPGLHDIVFDLLDGYGPDVADHLLTAVVNPDLGAGTREDAARLLVQTGIPSYETLLDGAADRPASIGGAVVDLVVSLGDDAVPDLARAYASGGWLSKIGLGREKIHARRGLIIRALSRLGSEAAVMALREIRMRETDPGLRGEAEHSLRKLAEER